MFYLVLCSLVLGPWICGSDGIYGFEIFRSEHDIFTNLKCFFGTIHSHECFYDLEQSCRYYNAKCVNSTCEYCRCLESYSTFIFENDPIDGDCKSDEKIVPESGNYNS